MSFYNEVKKFELLTENQKQRRLDSGTFIIRNYKDKYKDLPSALVDYMREGYENTIEFDNFDEYAEEIERIYHQIASVNIEKSDQDQEANIAYLRRISSKEGDCPSIIKLKLFNDTLFNLFRNKNNYFQVMQIIQRNEKLQDKILFDAFVKYAFNNREYYDEETFTAHLRRVLVDVLEEVLKQDVPNFNSFYQKQTKENQKKSWYISYK